MQSAVPKFSAALLVVLIASCGGESAESEGPQLVVQMLPGGNRCAVLQREFECQGIPAALRDLKISPDAFISVEFDPSVVPESQSLGILKSLHAAGFHLA